MKLTKLLIVGLLLIVNSLVFAAQFTVSNIKFVGLQRIGLATAIHYLPVQQGQVFDTTQSSRVIEALYNTGFFSNVQLARDGNTLIVQVDERPTISAVNVTGNKDIPKDKLDTALKQLGLEIGNVFDSATFSQVKQALSEQYYGMGRYNARIDASITREPQNSVAVNIDISEGMIAKVMGISVIGNKVFDEQTLIEQFQLSTPTLWSFFSSSDQYSKQKLASSVEALTNFYFDHGYLLMKVDSQQVTITPDRQHVYIAVHVTEGPQFRYSGYKITGDTILPKSTLEKLVTIKKGNVFSRSEVIKVNQAITTRLGDEGYAFAQVNVKPSLDIPRRLVFLELHVVPGKKYYVQHVNFHGNDGTSNIALRHSMTQMEGGLYSASKIQQSVQNLRQLPYLKPESIKVTPKPVGDTDQLDLNMEAAEQMSASLQFSTGYSQSYGFLIGASFTQNNFMGTGKTVGVNLTRTAYQRVYSVSYTNPFFTPTGISHSMTVYYQSTTPGYINIASYSTDVLGFSDSYGFPITNYQRFNLGYSYQHTYLDVGNAPSLQIKDFAQQYGNYFNQIMLTGGWSYSDLDQFFMPSKGVRQDISGVLSLPVGGESLDYVQGTYTNNTYLPMGAGFIFTTAGTYGIGAGYAKFGRLPFFENYYGGGLGVMGQNRAYQPNSLGPRDSNGQPLGGNVILMESIGVVVPTHISDRVRTTVFIDGGNVFNTQSYASGTGINVPLQWANLRYSAGLMVTWYTPLGMPLEFSMAEPIGYVSSATKANTQFFQFSIGGTF